MREVLSKIRHSLVIKVIFTSGITLPLCMALWSWFSLSWQERTLMQSVISEADRLSNTIRLGTHYAMMLDSENDIKQIVHNISKQPQLRAIRIYDKHGIIRYASLQHEQNTHTPPSAPSCTICHAQSNPPAMLPLTQRTRKTLGRNGEERLAVITPIPNEPACWQAACHAHQKTDTLLGLVDVEVTLANAHKQLANFRTMTIQLTIATCLLTFLSLLYFIFRYVNKPITELIEGTRRIARGGLGNVTVDQADEMGQLAEAINEMGKEVFEKHTALHQQQKKYQELFEGVPCIITVQDKDYTLLSYNKQFSDLFDPHPGDPCYTVYKGRDTPCPNCPVQKTLADGLSHVSEEEGVNKDGSPASWLVTTAPIQDEDGNIVAAMEMCLDITPRRRLEQQLQRSEEKYHAIFENIPSPVFVLNAETLEVLDTNTSMTAVYGYETAEIITNCFLKLFLPEEREYYKHTLAHPTVLNRVRHRKKNGDTIFVELRLSPAQFNGQEVLLATTGDITKRLEAEQQLIQASKMATLGEMATGVAHELNQPLSVIKTASGFFMRKIARNEPIEPEILQTMAEEIDSHIDRASRIITHLRDFGRKPEMVLHKVDVNHLIHRAYEMFSQQLTLRQIDMQWDLTEGMPQILCDSGRLEQVFINLLLNARDAIEERWGSNLATAKQEERRITFRSHRQRDRVVVEIADTGPGIPSRHAERIFEPFFTTKKIGKGTGLGLSISYGIIQDCGGSIHACTDDTSGAHFVINFPIPTGDKEPL